jgi:hypothetical protein
MTGVNTIAGALTAAERFGLDYGTVSKVRRAAAARHRTWARQADAYFSLLARLALKADGDRLAGILDRAERTLAEMSRRELGTVHCA